MRRQPGHAPGVDVEPRGADLAPSVLHALGLGDVTSAQRHDLLESIADRCGRDEPGPGQKVA
jgi:hypothetical protein